LAGIRVYPYRTSMSLGCGGNHGDVRLAGSRMRWRRRVGKREEGRGKKGRGGGGGGGGRVRADRGDLPNLDRPPASLTLPTPARSPDSDTELPSHLQQIEISLY
jgi:hypothetical protein